jgi:hypothetical protein
VTVEGCLDVSVHQFITQSLLNTNLFCLCLPAAPLTLLYPGTGKTATFAIGILQTLDVNVKGKFE